MERRTVSALFDETKGLDLRTVRHKVPRRAPRVSRMVATRATRAFLISGELFGGRQDLSGLVTQDHLGVSNAGCGCQLIARRGSWTG